MILDKTDLDHDTSLSRGAALRFLNTLAITNKALKSKLLKFYDIISRIILNQIRFHKRIGFSAKNQKNQNFLIQVMLGPWNYLGSSRQY